MKDLKNKKLIALCTFLMACVILFSCKKILNPDIIELPTSDNAITSSADVEKAIAGAYSFLRTVVPDKVFLFGDVRANTFESYSQSSNVRTETLIATNTQASLLNNDGGNWNQFYFVIAQCNLILEKIPTIANYDEDAKRRQTGEASFIRALTYFYLVRFWGDVPINLKSINLDNIPRSPQTEVFKQINSDLDVAIANLELSYGTGDVAVRATKGAAWAIKAHVMAWLHNYAECDKLCDSVINCGQYSLLPADELLRIFVGKSAEGIFEFNFDANLKEVQKNRVYNRTLGRPWYKDQSDGGGGTELFLLRPPADQQLQMFPSQTVITERPDKTLDTAFYGPEVFDKRYSTWFIQPDPAITNIPTLLYFGKYRTLQLNGDTASQNINESNIIVTRLADIMLLRAEALASPELGRPADATIWLNKVRHRAEKTAYVTGTGSIQDTILLERRKELLGEGQFFFDLVRTRKMAQYSKIKDADWYERGEWLLPIDQAIIVQSNFLITQNSYWQ